MKKVRPKKYLGQHFITDLKIAEKITNLISSNEKNVVEIGAGMGVLTQFLANKDKNLSIIEIDKDSIQYLKKKYPNLKKNINEEDFLKTDIKKDCPISFSLIGNFPYNISSQILFKVFFHKNQIAEVVGMFQKEVAQRIVSKKGRLRGILSVLMQTYYDIEYCFSVSKKSFYPVPKIETGEIKLSRNKRKSLGCDEKLFLNIVKAGFNQRRKTLRNALKSFSLENEITTSKVFQKRAEELSVEEFIRITISCQQKKEQTKNL